MNSKSRHFDCVSCLSTGRPAILTHGKKRAKNEKQFSKADSIVSEMKNWTKTERRTTKGIQTYYYKVGHVLAFRWLLSSRMGDGIWPER